MMARRWDEAIALLRKIVAARPDELDHQILLGRYAFAATGSTREADDWLARLGPAELESPRVVSERAYWAFVKGDYAGWKRLAGIAGLGVERNPYDGTSGRFRDASFLAASGDLAGARVLLAGAPAELRTALELEPANATLWGQLARTEALLGHKEQALHSARKALELMPESRDAFIGPKHSRDLAIVYAWTGEKDQAIAELTRLIRIPAFGSELSVHTLRVSSQFAPLRGDPRFEALLKDPKNHAPLF
jgi:tetratricopeptide (TPR) repeat protein